MNIKGVVLILITTSFLFISYRYYMNSNSLISSIDLKNIYESKNIKNNNYCRQLVDKTYRCLPKIMFIGTSKCGTSSMARYLLQHPRIGLIKRSRKPSRKNLPLEQIEVHRFDHYNYENKKKILSLYEEYLSAPIFYTLDECFNISNMHYTPHYIYDPEVPLRIKEFYPHANELKFIVMLRDPIDRAISSYWFKNSHLFTSHNINSINISGNSNSFDKNAIRELKSRKKYVQCCTSYHQQQLKQKKDEEDQYEQQQRYLSRSMNVTLHTDKGSSRDRDSNSNSREMTSLMLNEAIESEASCLRCRDLLWPTNPGLRHIDKGRYLDQLRRWFHLFPKKNFYLLTLEKFQSNPTVELHKLFLWLDIPFLEDDSHHDNKEYKLKSSTGTSTSSGGTSSSSRTKNGNGYAGVAFVKEMVKTRYVTMDSINLGSNKNSTSHINIMYDTLPQDSPLRKRLRNIFNHQIIGLEEIMSIDLKELKGQSIL